MRAAVLERYHEPLMVRDLPCPEPGPGEALVRVRACGVCGSDLFLQKGGFASVLPMVPGHEASGEVAAVGTGVTEVRPGDRVALYYLVYCGTCRFCLEGRPNICRSVSRMGVDRFGAMAEYVVMPARNLLPIEASVSYEAAAVITDAIATPLHALRVAQTRPGENVLVLGVGGIGSNAIVLARLLGARVIAATRSEQNRRLAESLGADAVLLLGADLAEQVRQVTAGAGADVVLQCAPSAAAYEAGLGALANGGRMVVVGSVTEPVALPMMQILWREAQVLGSRGFTPEDISQGLAWFAQGQLNIDHLLRHTAALDQVNEALQNLQNPAVTRTVILL